MPGTDNENLKQYIIDVDVNIKKAEDKLSKLQKDIDKGIEAGQIKQDIKGMTDEIEKMFKNMSDTIKTSINEGFAKVDANTLKRSFKDVKKTFDEFNRQIDTTKDQIDLLSSTLNSGDFAKFERFIDAFTAPLGELNKSIREIQESLNSLVEPINTISSKMTAGFTSNTKAIANFRKATDNELKDYQKRIQKFVDNVDKTFAQIGGKGFKKYEGGLSTYIKDIVGKGDDKDLQKPISDLEEVLTSISALRSEIDSINKELASEGITINISDELSKFNISDDILQRAEKTLKSVVNKKPSDLSINTQVNLNATVSEENIDEITNDLKSNIISKITDKLEKSTDDKAKIQIPITINKKGIGDEIRNAIAEFNRETKSDEESDLNVEIPIIPKVREDQLEKIGGKIQEQIVSEGGLSLNGGSLSLSADGNLATEKTVADIRDILSSFVGGKPIKVVNENDSASSGLTKDFNKLKSSGLKNYEYVIGKQMNSQTAQRLAESTKYMANLEVSQTAEKAINALLNKIKSSFLGKKEVDLKAYLEKSPLFTEVASDGILAKYGFGETLEEFQEKLSNGIGQLVDKIKESIKEKTDEVEGLKSGKLTEEAKKRAIDVLEKQREASLKESALQEYINKNQDHINDVIRSRNKKDEEEIQLLKDQDSNLFKELTDKNKDVNLSTFKRDFINKYKNNNDELQYYFNKIKEKQDKLNDSSNGLDFKQKNAVIDSIEDLYSNAENYIAELLSDDKYNQLKEAVKNANKDDVRKSAQTKLDEYIAERKQFLNSISESDLVLFNQIKEYEKTVAEHNKEAENIRARIQHRNVNNTAESLISSDYKNREETVNNSKVVTDYIRSLLDESLKGDVKTIVINAVKGIEDKTISAFNKLTEYAKKVDPYTNANINLSNNDYKEYIKLSEELGKQFPDLVKGYDDEGNAMLDLGEKAKKVTNDLQESAGILSSMLQFAHGQTTKYRDYLGYGKDRAKNKTTEEEYGRDLSRLKIKDVVPYLLSKENISDINFSDLGKQLGKNFSAVSEEQATHAVKNTLDALRKKGQEDLEIQQAKTADLIKEKEILEEIVELRKEEKDYSSAVEKLQENGVYQINKEGQWVEGRINFASADVVDSYIRTRLPVVENFLEESKQIEGAIQRYYNTVGREFASSVYNSIDNKWHYKSSLEKYDRESEEYNVLKRNLGSLSPEEGKRYGILKKSLPQLRAALVAYEEVNANEEEVLEEQKRRAKLIRQEENTNYINHAFTANGAKAFNKVNGLYGDTSAVNWAKNNKFKNTSDKELQDIFDNNKLVSQDLENEINSLVDGKGNILDKVINERVNKAIKERITNLENLKKYFEDKIAKNKENAAKYGTEYKPGFYEDEIAKIDKSITAIKNNDRISQKEGKTDTYRDVIQRRITKEIQDQVDASQKLYEQTNKLDSALQEELATRKQNREELEALTKSVEDSKNVDIKTKSEDVRKQLESKQSKYAKTEEANKAKAANVQKSIDALNEAYTNLFTEAKEKVKKAEEAVHTAGVDFDRKFNEESREKSLKLVKLNSQIRKSTDDKERKELQDQYNQIQQEINERQSKYNKQKEEAIQAAQKELELAKQTLDNVEQTTEAKKIQKKIDAETAKMQEYEANADKARLESHQAELDAEAEFQRLKDIQNDRKKLNELVERQAETENKVASAQIIQKEAGKDAESQARLAAIKAKEKEDADYEDLDLVQKIAYWENKIANEKDKSKASEYGRRLKEVRADYLQELNADEYRQRDVEPFRPERRGKHTTSESTKDTDISTNDTTVNTPTATINTNDELIPGQLATEATLKAILETIRGEGAGASDEDSRISKLEQRLSGFEQKTDAIVNALVGEQSDESSEKSTEKKVKGEKKVQEEKEKTRKASKRTQQEEKKEGEIAEETAKKVEKSEKKKQFNWEQYQNSFKENISKLYDLDSKGKISRNDNNEKLIRNIFNGMFSLNNQGGTLTYDSITKNIKNTSNKKYIKEIYEQVAAWRELCKAGEEWNKISQNIKDAAKRSQSGKATNEDYQLLYDNGYAFRKNKYGTYSAIQATTHHNSEYLELMQGREAIQEMLKASQDAESKKQTAKKETIKTSEKVQAAEKQEGIVAKETAEEVIKAEEKKQSTEVLRPQGSSLASLQTIPSQYINGYVRSLDDIKEQLLSEGVPKNEVNKKAKEIRNAEIKTISDLSDGFVRVIHRTRQDVLDSIVKNGLGLKGNGISGTTSLVQGKKIDPKYNYGTHNGMGSFIVADIPEDYYKAFEHKGIPEGNLGDLKRQYDIEQEILSISEKIDEIYNDTSALEERNRLFEKLLELGKEYNNLVGNGGNDSLSLLLYGDRNGGFANRTEYNSIEKIQALLKPGNNVINDEILKFFPKIDEEGLKTLTDVNELIVAFEKLEKLLNTTDFGANASQGLKDYRNHLVDLYEVIEDKISNQGVFRVQNNRGKTYWEDIIENKKYKPSEKTTQKIWNTYFKDQSSLEDSTKELENVGEKASDAIVKGAKKGTKKTKKAGKDLGEALNEGAREATDEHSPSKTAEIIGLYYVQGLEEGLVKGLPDLKKVVKYVLTKGLATHNDIRELFEDAIIDPNAIYNTILNNSELKGHKKELKNSELIGAITEGAKDDFADIINKAKKLEDAYKIRNRLATQLNKTEKDSETEASLKRNLDAINRIVKKYEDVKDIAKNFKQFANLDQYNKDYDTIISQRVDQGNANQFKKTLEDYIELINKYVEAKKKLFSSGSAKNLTDTEISSIENFNAFREGLEETLSTMTKTKDQTEELNQAFKEADVALEALSQEEKNFIATENNKKVIDEYKDISRSIKEIVSLLVNSKGKSFTETEKERLNELIELWHKAINAEEEYAISEGGKESVLKEAKTAQNQFKKSGWSSYIDDARSELTKLETSLNRILKNSGKYTTEYLVAITEQLDKIKLAKEDLPKYEVTNLEDLDKLVSIVTEVKTKSEDLFNAKQNNEYMAANIRTLEKYRGKVAKILNENTRMPKELKEQFLQLAHELDNFDFLTGTREQALQLTTTFEHLNAELIRTNKLGLNIFDRFKKELASTNARLIAQFFSFYDIIRYTRQIVSTVRELDTALVDLRKTTSMTATELDEFYYSSNKIAQQMGVTTQEIIQQAANWSRLGYSTKEASEQMAALSSQFAAISPGMDVNTATDGLVSAMKAFHVEVESVESDLMDPINRLGNTMATTNEEIVNMLERSSAAMYAANNSIEETLALESAAVQITRNAENTGTAFRTISMRIRGYDEETEELSEEYENLSGKIANLTKTAKTPGGISLFTDKDKQTFKSTYQLLKDISEIWDDLTDKQQAQLLEKLAGKRGGQVLSGILGKENFAEVERAMGEILQSAGSADAEMEIIQDSIEYKINAIKQSWVGFLQEALKRNDIKELFDTLVTGSESLQKSLISIAPVLTEIIKLLSKFLDTFAKINDSTNGLAGIGALLFGFGKAKGIGNGFGKKLGTELVALKDYFKKPAFSVAQAGAMESEALLAAAQDGINADVYSRMAFGMSLDEIKAFKTEVPKATSSFVNFFKVTGEGTGKFGAFAAKLGLSSAALTGVIAVAGAFVYSLYKVNKAQGEIIKQAEEAQRVYSEQADSIEDYREKALEYQSIANDNTKSIAEQQEARENLLNLQQQMVDEFGVEAAQIDILTDSIDKLNRGFDNLSERHYQEFLNSVNRNEGWDGFWHKLYTGETFNDNVTNWSTIRDQMEHAHFAAGINKLDVDNISEILESEFKKEGLDVRYDVGTDSLIGDNNLRNYYEALLNIQRRYAEKTDEDSQKIANHLTKYANEVGDTLKSIEGTYNSVFEHDVINKSYKREVNEISRLKEELRKAQIEGNEDSVKEITQKLINAYNGVIKKANGNEEIENWFSDFVSEVQNLMDEQTFVAKIQPELNTDLSKEFNIKKEQIANSINPHMYEDEVAATAESDLTEDEIMAKYGEDYAEIISWIRRIASQEKIPISLVVEKLEVPNKARKDLEEKLNKVDKKVLNNLSEEEIEYLQKLEPYELSIINSTDQLTAALKRLHEVQNQKWSKTEMIDNLTEMADGFDKIDEIYADVFDKGSFDFSKLNTKKFQEAFGDLGLDYEQFIETVSGHTDDLEYCQSAFNDLIDTFIRSSGILDNVTKENASLTKSMLEMYGVTNADILVTEALQEAEAKDWLTKKDLTNITPELAKKLGDEAEQAGLSRQAVYELMLAEIDLNNTELDLSDVVSQIESVAIAAGIAKGEIANLSTMDRDGDGKSGTLFDPYAHGGGFESYTDKNGKKVNGGGVANLMQQVRDKIKAQYKAPTKAEYGGGDKTKDAKEKASNSAAEDAELFDWIETKIQRLEREITNLGKTADATFKTWAERTVALGEEMEKVNEQISLQQTAYATYLKQAEAIDLAQEYKDKVMNGTLDVESISDKTLKKNIKDFKEVYEKALAAKDKVDDLQSSLANLAKTKFDNITSQFDDIISDVEHMTKYITAQLESVETVGKIAGKSFYEAQIAQEKERLNDLTQELGQLQSALAEGLASGAIAYGSQMFNEMKKSIYSVEESILDANNAILKFEQNIKQVAKANFDDLKSQFESAISILTDKIDLTDKIVNMVQATGHIASKAYYDALITGTDQNIQNLKKKYDELNKVFNDAVASGDVKEFSDEWYDMKSGIEAVKGEIIDATNSLIEYKNQLRQINWDLFDRGQTRLEQLISESQFLIDLYEKYPLFDKETGDITSKGMATRGLLVQNYETYISQARQLQEEIAKLKEELKADPGSTTLIDRIKELEQAERDAILSSEGVKESLRDLLENEINALLEALQKLIDQYKKSLQAQKDLHDFQKNIDQQNKNINALKKQLMAYDNGSDTTEENRARVQKINDQLKQAEDQLKETEYDRYIQETQTLLDDFMQSLRDYFDEKLLDLNWVLERAIEDTNLNAEAIRAQIEQTGVETGYVYTEEFTKIWDNMTASDSLFSEQRDILASTGQVCTDIQAAVMELPTDQALASYLDGSTLQIVSEIANVDSAVGGVQSAIGETNQALAQIQSKIAEYNASVLSSIADAKAAAERANQEAQAAQATANEAKSKAGSGNSGGLGGGSSNNGSSNTGTYEARVYYVEGFNHGGMLIERLDDLTYAEAQEKAKRYYKANIRHYAKGGLVSKDKNPLDFLAQQLGEDHMVAAKEGERILTAKQNENFEKLANAFSNLSSEDMAKYSILTGSKVLSNMPQLQMPTLRSMGSGNNTEINGGISINLPNVTNKAEFIEWLKTDGQIEKIVQSMTLGRLQGKNSYDKMKY